MPRSASLIVRFLRYLAVPILVTVVPSFLLFSQQQLRDLVERFFSDCAFVIQKEDVKPGQVLLTARLSGTPPKSLPLVFEADDAVINSVVFDDAYREGLEKDPADLAFHPLTGSVCPGPLCSEAGPSPDRLMFPVTLTDLHKDFAYRFRVRLKPFEGKKASSANLKVYAIFDRGLQDGVCRVQPQKWWNFWVWASGVEKVLLFALVVAVCSALMKFSSSERT